MTNNERQRKFQLANPGYDARRKGRERAMMKASSRRWQAARIAAAAAERAADGPQAAGLNVDVDGQLLLFPAMAAAA